MLTIHFMDKGGIIRADSEVEDFVNRVIKKYLRNKDTEPDREIKVSNHLICQSFRVAVKEGRLSPEEICFRNGDFAAYTHPGGKLDSYEHNVDGGNVYENNLYRMLGY